MEYDEIKKNVNSKIAELYKILPEEERPILKKFVDSANRIVGDMPKIENISSDEALKVFDQQIKKMKRIESLRDEMLKDINNANRHNKS